MSTPTLCAIIDVIFSRSYACHPSRHTRVSVQATRKRERRSNSNSARYGQPDCDPPLPLLTGLQARQQRPILKRTSQQFHKTSLTLFDGTDQKEKSGSKPLNLDRDSDFRRFRLKSSRSRARARFPHRSEGST